MHKVGSDSGAGELAYLRVQWGQIDHFSNSCLTCCCCYIVLPLFFFLSSTSSCCPCSPERLWHLARPQRRPSAPQAWRPWPPLRPAQTAHSARCVWGVGGSNAVCPAVCAHAPSFWHAHASPLLLHPSRSPCWVLVAASASPCPCC